MDVNDLYQIKNGHTGKVVAEGLASNFAALAKELDSNSTTAAIKSLKGYGKQDVPMGVSIFTTDGDFILPSEWATLGAGKTADGIMVSDGTHFTIFNTTIGQNLAFGPINSDIGGIPNISDPAVARLDFDGKAHSAALTEANPAYAYCLGIGPDYYLPAAGQLYDAMQGSTEFNKALEALGLPLLAEGDTFWSSTEIDLDKAWAVGYPAGTTTSADKTITYKVMAVKDYVAPQDALLSEDNTLNEALHILSTNTQNNTIDIGNIKYNEVIHVSDNLYDWIKIGEVLDITSSMIITLSCKYAKNNRIYVDNYSIVISGEGEGLLIGATKITGNNGSPIFEKMRFVKYNNNDTLFFEISRPSYNKIDVNLHVSYIIISYTGKEEIERKFIFYPEATKGYTNSGFSSILNVNINDSIYATFCIKAKYIEGIIGSANESLLFEGRNIPFTPTLDYEPSTKKYVDDSIKKGVKFDGIVHLPAAAGYYKFADIDDGRNMNLLLNLVTETSQVTFLISLGKNRTLEILKLNGSSGNDLYEIQICSSPDNTNRQLGVRKLSISEIDMYISCIILSSNPLNPNSSSNQIHPGTVTLLDTAVTATIPDGWVEYKMYLGENGVSSNYGINTTKLSGKDVEKFLYQGRTNIFEPTIDYEPATKKYVDDRHNIVTPEEYAALGDVVNTDNKIYFITEQP